MKNTAAIPGLPQSPSPPYHLQWSTCLVCCNSGYFMRNCTISTVQFLLHGWRHDRKQGKWNLGWCESIFMLNLPKFITLHHHLNSFCLLFISWSSWVGCSSGSEGDVSLSKMPHATILRWDRIWMDRAMNQIFSGEHHNDFMEVDKGAWVMEFVCCKMYWNVFCFTEGI